VAWSSLVLAVSWPWEDQERIERLLGRMFLRLEEIESYLRLRSKPTQIVLCLPTRTDMKGNPMPNFELPNDEIVTIPIQTTNQAGSVEPVPTGDVFTVASSSPSLGVAVGATAAGNPAIVLTPTVQASPGIVVTVSDSAGLKLATLTVDIVPDVTPANIVLDVADATHVAQPVPAAPGP
jgi:hypothetical protein